MFCLCFIVTKDYKTQFIVNSAVEWRVDQWNIKCKDNILYPKSWAKRSAMLFLLIEHLTSQKIDEAIIHVRCVLLQVHPLTLKHRHSIRIWSWGIRWGKKWINILAGELWPPAKQTGIPNVSSSRHHDRAHCPLRQRLLTVQYMPFASAGLQLCILQHTQQNALFVSWFEGEKSKKCFEYTFLFLLLDHYDLRTILGSLLSLRQINPAWRESR